MVTDELTGKLVGHEKTTGHTNSQKALKK